MSAVMNDFQMSIELLAAAYREVPIGLCLFDSKLRYMYINEWLASLNHRTIEQHIGKTIGEVIPDIADEAESQLQWVLDSGEMIIDGEVEIESQRRPGEIILFQHSYRPVRQGGKIVGVSCVVQDITKQRQAERLKQEIKDRELAERAKRSRADLFRDLAEAAPDATIFTDLEGKIRLVNAQVEKLFGYAADELIGKTVEILMPNRFREIHLTQRRLYAQTPDARDIETSQELLGLCKDGKAIPVEVRLGQIDTSVGPRLVTSIRDITKRKEAEQAAQKYHAELTHAMRLETVGQMATGIAHELNQPLGAIAVYAGTLSNLLSKPGKDPEKLKRIAESLSKQALRSGEILKKMREFVSRSESKMTRCNLNAAIQDMVTFLEPNLLASQTELQLQLESTPVEIDADVIQIQQVLVNLVRNAIDAMNELPQIRRKVIIEVSRHEQQVVVNVQDQGKGVAEQELLSIFDEFYTSKTDGMGMGLAISRSIIENHGGRLEARSNKSAGMSFLFTLPINEGAP